MRSALLMTVLACAVLACGEDAPATDDDAGTGGGGGVGGNAGGNAGGAGPIGGLTFIDDHNIPSGGTFDGVEVGGLSGLFIEPSSGASWAICDDQNQFGPPRLYTLDVSLTETTVDANVTSQVTFVAGSTPADEVDAEGIARTAAGDLWVSTEGDTTPVVPPQLLRFDGAGMLLEELPVDTKFIPDGPPQTRGVGRNLGFEALTISPSGERLFTATEQALVQDGDRGSMAAGTRCRVVIYDLATGGAPVEHVYLTEPVPPASPGVLGEASIGVPEMLALSNERLLVLERASVEVDGIYTNTIRIFEVDLEGAADVSASVALAPDAVALPKRLVLDLDTVIPELDPAFPRLDNFEAMSFGPNLPDGRRSLILLSDNNFNPVQRTAFFAFAID